MSKQYTFATWNIACGAKAWYGKGAADIAAFFKAQHVDFAACQEVDRHAKRTNFQDMPSILEKHSGLDAIFCPSITFLPEYDPTQSTVKRQFGNVILTKPIVLQHICVRLGPIHEPKLAKHKGEAEPRIAIFAEIQTEKGSFWVVTTHLAYSPQRSPSPIRKAQVFKLLSAIKSHIPAESALILGGDFNAEIKNPDLEPLTTYLTHHPTQNPTFPLGRDAEQPHRYIDLLFSRNIDMVNITTHTAPEWSDHAGVFATFSL